MSGKKDKRFTASVSLLRLNCARLLVSLNLLRESQKVTKKSRQIPDNLVWKKKIERERELDFCLRARAHHRNRKWELLDFLRESTGSCILWEWEHSWYFKGSSSVGGQKWYLMGVVATRTERCNSHGIISSHSSRSSLCPERLQVRITSPSPVATMVSHYLTIDSW